MSFRIEFPRPRFFSAPLVPFAAGLIALTGCLICLGTTCHAAERWTSLNGTNTVEAEFIGLWGDKVVLELPGPRRVSVSLDDLIADSRIQARRLAEEKQARRAEMRQQILADAKEAAAPAPTPLPQPRTPPAYQPLPGGSGLLAFFEWQEQQDRNGHGLIARFDALPASYQTDLERLVRASLAKLDPQATNQVLASVHSVGDLIVTRQRWLFSHPRLGAIDEASKDTLKSVVLAFGGLIRDGIDPNQLNLEGLQTRPLRSWLMELDTRLAPHLAALSDQTDMLGIQAPSYEVKDEKDGKATVEITFGEAKQQIAMESVQGKWIFAEMNAEKWGELTKQWDESLANVPDGSLLAGGIAQVVPLTVQTYLQPATAAQSAREFHAAMDGWLAMASPLIAQAGNLGFGNSRRRGGMYGDDMDDYYEDEMGMEGYEDEMGMEDYDEQMSGYGSGSRPPGSGSRPPR